MDQRRYEPEFDEFEKLLLEIPKVTSGNDYSPFPLCLSSTRSSPFQEQHLHLPFTSAFSEENLNFGISTQTHENPQLMFSPSYHSPNTSPCVYADTFDSRKLDPRLFRKLQPVGCFPSVSPSQPQQHYMPSSLLVRSQLGVNTAKVINYGVREDSQNQRHWLQNHQLDEDLSTSLNNLTLQPPKFFSIAEARGKIYYMGKDQHGCRFLQRKFAEGDVNDIRMIFHEIIDYISELMVDPFGNYLVQKLLEVCNDDQRMQIVCLVARKPGLLIKISCDKHGTRVVQKIVETVKRQEEIPIIISALRHGIVTLMKNVNGNHVVLRCLQYLLPHCKKFLFEAAVTYCVDLATDRHGCCVLQKCIDYFQGEYKDRLVSEIASNALLLSQDPFGNYALKYVFEWAVNEILEQLEGSYTELSMQKCSSNVVEKCLTLADDKHQARIIRELITCGCLEQVMLDPYGNYVIQAALNHSKGALHGILVGAIKVYVPSLRTNPYGKKVLSALNSKK